MEETVLDNQLKGVTIKIFWQFIVGWTSIIVVVIGTFYSLKNQLALGISSQGRTDAIQEIRIDANKQANEFQALQIKDLNERYNELASRIKTLEDKK